MNKVKRPIPPARRAAPVAQEVQNVNTLGNQDIPLNAYLKFTVNYMDGRGEHIEYGRVVGVGPERLMVSCDDIHGGDRGLSLNKDHVLQWWLSKEDSDNPGSGSYDPTVATGTGTLRVEGGYLLGGYFIPFEWTPSSAIGSVALATLDGLYTDPMEAEVLAFKQTAKYLWQTPERIGVEESGYYLVFVRSGNNYAAQLVYMSGMDKVYLGQATQVPVLRIEDEWTLHPDETQRGRELAAITKGFEWGLK